MLDSEYNPPEYLNDVICEIRASMKRLLPLLTLLLTFSSLLLFSPSTRSAPPPPKDQSEVEIETALYQAIEQHKEDIVAFLIFDIKITQIQFDQTGQWAVVWLDLYDPSTGALVPTEPGLVVAYFDGGEWNILLQSDPEWSKALTAVPADLMPEENKAIWLSRYDQVRQETPTAALDGYLLPWAAGLTKLLTRSIAHGGTGYYAFDFGDGTMFPLYASKGGTVHLVQWTYPNGFDDGSCAHSNYIILKDETTVPVTYQLYLHLAYDSIPEDLRVIGAPVLQGQFIGNADDTGCSTGHHIHFHVHTNPNYFWGTALDITFDDVDINGGRPRTSSEASDPDCTPAPCVGRSTYTSQNTIVADLTAPTGGLFTPNSGDTITASTLTLEGWALDEGSGVESAYFMANYNDAWVQVGPVFTDLLFSYTWDWCADNVSDGPVSLAINVKDEDGNQATLLGLRHVIKNHPCTNPPPTCTPAANQVALFTAPNYGGECLTLDPGDNILSFVATGLSAAPLSGEANPAQAGGVTVSSVKLGSAARVTLYREIFSGRGQTFYTNDPNLSDNWIGTQEISLAVVAPKTASPAFPPVPVWPSGETFTDTASVSLVWDDGGGSAEFRAQYTGPGGTITSPWQPAPVWHLGSLDDGGYSWQVRARNQNGNMTGWSSPATFIVEVSTVPPLPTSTAPYTATFESGANNWAGSGLWNLLNDSSAAHDGSSFAWWYGAPPFASGTYDTAVPNSGDLTSPPISIPIADTYYLRFWSWQDTENGTNWDRRWVQISANGGAFTNVLQIYDDPAEFWVQSPFIDLSPYAGQTIRIRFHFETLDARDNAHKGWLIDDLTINTTALPVCAPDEGGPLAFGGSVSGAICPAGDVDIFTFTGNTGNRIGVNVDAQSAGSNLDPYLFLLAEDGTSVVAENDDEVLYTLIDPLLGITLPWDGDYYLKLRAWNHPGAGDPDHYYTMTLFLDPDAPTISALSPAGSLTTNFFVQADTVVDITANVTDVGSGMERVEFWFHSGDWAAGSWTLLGMDTDGSDGWALPGGWDTNSVPDQLGMAIFVRAVDRAGNVAPSAAWNLAVDRVPPQTTVVTLPPVMDTTAMLLEWSSTDNIAPIREYDVQWNVDEAGWTLYQSDLISSTRQLWVIGEFDSLYGFRVRAVDEAGNLEPYNGVTNQTTTFIEPCDEPDAWEEDNTFTTSQVFTGTQTHNFCDAGDEDWVQLFLEANATYFITTTPLDPSAAVVVELYGEDGTTLLSQVFPQDPNGLPTSGTDTFGLPTLLIFRPTTSAPYFLRLTHPVSSVAGSAVQYELAVNSYQVFMPVIVR